MALTEAGVLDDVEMLFGFHLRPLEECPMGQGRSGDVLLSLRDGDG